MSQGNILAHMGINISGLQARSLFDHGHWEIHQGYSYAVAVYDGTLASGEYIEACFKSPLTKEMHIVTNFAALANVKLEYFENCDWSGGQTGTQVVVGNRNRRKTHLESAILDDWRASGVWEPSGMIKQGVSGMSGSLMYTKYAFGAKFASIAETRGRAEFITETGIQYCLRLTSLEAANGAQLEIDWYEEDV